MAKLKKGYIYIWDKHRKRHNYEHRLVMEAFLQRDLLSTEQVHHINRNPADNRIENLELCTDFKTHYLKHDIWGRRLFSKCELCGNKHHAKGLCKNHYAKRLRQIKSSLPVAPIT